MDAAEREGPGSESPPGAGPDTPLRRFRVGRYVIMLLFAFMAVAYLAPAVTGVVVAIDSAGDAKVNLKRLTEGGTPVGGPEVAYGTFILISAVSVAIVVAAAVAALCSIGDRPRPTAWTVLVAAGVLGAGGALVALALDTGEVGTFLASIAVCFALLVAAGLFELWRARWLRDQPAAPARDAVSPTTGAPAG
jgi:hypothetical protein